MSLTTLIRDISEGLEKLPPDRHGKYVSRMIRNNLPLDTCPGKKSEMLWKREKVISALPEQIRSSIGPSLLKV